jgi:hypothetical protein
VFDDRHDRDGRLGDVDDFDGGGASGGFLLLGDVVGGRVGVVAGSGGLGGLLGLVAAVAWVGGTGWVGGHAGDVGGGGGGLGDGVGDDGRTALVADVDGGDGVVLALVAYGLGDGLRLCGYTGLARVNISCRDDSLGRASWVRRVVVCRNACNRRRVFGALSSGRGRFITGVVGNRRSTVSRSRA